MNITKIPLSILMLMACSVCATQAQPQGDDYYTGERVYKLRPDPSGRGHLGAIGPTGIIAMIDTGVKVTVTGTQKGSPADGKFQEKEVITGVNGKSLAGLNPYVVLGEAITAAEATDGKLVFDVVSAKGTRKEAVQIPVMGAYAKNWPVDCPKSRKIIDNAATYYADLIKVEDGEKGVGGGIGGATACLYLLSTGDDQYLPLIKAHYQGMMDDPGKIGDHTWNNGWNGITCAEYYLRTGDKDILPVLQAFCDDARDRQNYDSAWKHWGTDINPAYVAGGLMNPASVPVLTTLILSKEAGVNVDEKTLMNALRYFYRFSGRGAVAYGDHRTEGGIASNGKDAMLAAAMQAASGASGDTSIYQMARDNLGMATLNGYPDMMTGHADFGRGDGIWRGIASYYAMDKAPERFREVMDRITWWYDLSRSFDGSMGLASVNGWNMREDSGGAATMLLFTAPLKTLRITGAPRTEHSKPFQLPESLWGREADLAFYKITPVEGYETFGKEEPIHRINHAIGSAYTKGAILKDPESVSVEQLNRYIRHESIVVRTHAAYALRMKGESKLLEELLQHPDPRMRRAALDGILDWNFWGGGSGKEALKSDQYTPAMIKTITAMINNPKEALYVIDAALFAMGKMSPQVIQENFETIRQWSGHDDWWMRQGAFAALQGLQNDPQAYIKVAPMLVDLMTRENHAMPRSSMNGQLLGAIKKFGSDSEIGKLLSKGFEQSFKETQILEGERYREGSYNIYIALQNSTRVAPDLTPALALALAERGLSKLDDKKLRELLHGKDKDKGLIAALDTLDDTSKASLLQALDKHYRPEVARRLKASGGKDIAMTDSLIALNELSGMDAGWITIGSPEAAKRQWQYHSFDPIDKKDMLPKHDGRRMRVVSLPSGLEAWFKPEFKPSNWQTGLAPIGKGSHPRDPKNRPPIASPWGAGEILLARTTFEVSETDFAYDVYRLKVLSQQGFHIYLNGKIIEKYGWWQDVSVYKSYPFNVKSLKKGTNTLAIYTFEVYPSQQKKHWKGDVYGKVDLRIEGLKIADLYEGITKK